MHIFNRFCFGTLALAVVLTAARPAFARTDVVLAWNEAVAQYLAAHETEIPPHAQARACAMAHLAIEQAILTTRDTSQPVGQPDDEQQIAAITAAHEVLVRVLPGTADYFGAVASAQLRELACEPAAKTRAVAAGHAAAAVVLQKREADKWVGSDPLQAAIAALSVPLVPIPTEDQRPPKSPWLGATPFILKSAAQFEVDCPRWSDLDGRMYSNAFLERGKMFDSVDRTVPPDTLMQFWSEPPVVAWNRIARTLVARAGLDLAGRAHVLAVVNLAMADAALSSMHWRFTWNRWQPRWAEGFAPVLGTPSATDTVAQIDGSDQTIVVRPESRRVLIPPVRNFPSVSATVAGAASAALARAIEMKQPGFLLASRATGNLAIASSGRNYDSVAAAARECAFVASLDGRHSREACVAGYRLGENIGNYIAKQTRTPRR